MNSKPSLFRLDADSHAALVQLSRLLQRPMNKLVNEAVRDYLQKPSHRERELDETLANLRAYRNHHPLAADSPVNPSGEGAVLLGDRAGREAVAAAGEFGRRIARALPVKSIVLFGSRARGTHRADSDVDLAVVLRGPRGDLTKTSLQMADLAFEVLLETDIYLQPLPLWEDEWDRPEIHSNPRLVENIRREGLPL